MKNNQKQSNTKQYFFKNQENQACFLTYNFGHPINLKNVKFLFGQIKVFITDEKKKTKCLTANIQSSQNLNLKFDWDQAFFQTIIQKFKYFTVVDYGAEDQDFDEAASKKNKKAGTWIFIKTTIQKQNKQTQQLEQKVQTLIQCKLNEQFSKNPLKQLWTLFGVYNQYKVKTIQKAQIKKQQLKLERQQKTKQLMRKSQANEAQMDRLQKQLSLLLAQKIKRLNTLGQNFVFQPIFNDDKSSLIMQFQEPNQRQIEMQMMPTLNGTLFQPSQYYH